MRVSLAQTTIFWEEKNKNIENAREIVETYASSDIILFPEMSFTGFSMNTDITAEDEKYTSEKIQKMAMEHNVFIGYGWVKRTVGKEKSENVYTIMAPNGKIISEYTKMHPFSYSGEDKYFRRGNKTTKYKILGVPCSTFICYDLRFPEVFRSVAEFAHVIIIPACWPEKRNEHWKTLLRARAIENQVYILGINCQGNIGGLYYSGDSCIINPDGQVLETISSMSGVITYELEDDVDKYRKVFPVLMDKRI